MPTRQRQSTRLDSSRMRELRMIEPRTPAQLHRFVKVVLGLDVPREALTAGGSPPFDYLVRSFFEDTRGPEATGFHGDSVVWANRGGGKTMLGAAATLLDLLFKPGVQVRILGGSLEQSSKMYEHLLALLDRPMMRGVLRDEPTQRRIELINGSRAAILAGSQRSVRGVRVHKLRCDEVEEFDPAVWQAAQLVTRSGWCGDKYVRGSVEALSTMHRPFGLMSELVAGRENAGHAGNAGNTGNTIHTPNSVIFKWTAMDVIARCEPERVCAGCELWTDCGGKAKTASGFIPVDDLIAQRRRTSNATWEAEMMCRRPQTGDCVYANFDPAVHVKQTHAEACSAEVLVAGGMDFGLRSPLVMLWAVVIGSGDVRERAVHVVDEYLCAGKTLEEHLEVIERREIPAPSLADSFRGGVACVKPDWVGVDPAGRQRNSHTGLSDIDVLRRRGWKVRTRGSTLRDGIERIRRRLDRGTLTIHPRCVKLIEAMQCYHFDPARPQRAEPIKDGPDHACDALRYMILNLECGARGVKVRGY